MFPRGRRNSWTNDMWAPREDVEYAFRRGKQPARKPPWSLAVARRRIQNSPISAPQPHVRTPARPPVSPRLCAPMAASAEGDPSPPPRGWLSGLVSGAGRLLAAVLDPESSASDTTSSSPESSQSPPRRALAAAGTHSPFLPQPKFQMPREMLAP